MHMIQIVCNLLAVITSIAARLKPFSRWRPGKCAKYERIHNSPAGNVINAFLSIFKVIIKEKTYRERIDRRAAAGNT